MKRKNLKKQVQIKLTRKNRTPMIKAYDKFDSILGKGILLASASILVPTDTIITSIVEHKRPDKAFRKVSREIKKRLNKGEGRGRHFLGVTL